MKLLTALLIQDVRWIDNSCFHVTEGSNLAWTTSCSMYCRIATLPLER
jgi:hypothetical protein